ncbi:MAG TPA: hypothetical protein VNO35_01335 [Steroidobacteraceae bacterium]|nr:hypothetical protein [Steroidobacteraceae bacterium]
MRQIRHPGALKQMALFHAQSVVPPWLSLPAEVREQALKLLARFLRQHRKARLVAQEVHDE